MVYTSSEQYVENRVEHTVPRLLDPGILRSARQIYHTYYEVHPKITQRPLGIAIHRFTHRGKLIFSGKPILLPQECFIPLNQLESEMY